MSCSVILRGLGLTETLKGLMLVLVLQEVNCKLRQRHLMGKSIKGLHPGLIWMAVLCVSLAIPRFQPCVFFGILCLYSNCGGKRRTCAQSHLCCQRRSWEIAESQQNSSKAFKVPWEVADAASLEVRLDGALSNLVSWKVSLPAAGGWNKTIFKVLSNQSCYMILCKTKIHGFLRVGIWYHHHIHFYVPNTVLLSQVWVVSMWFPWR